MAHEPCSACGQPFFGRSSYVYPALYNGHGKMAGRKRLDPACFRIYLSNIEQHMVEANDGHYNWPNNGETCSWCGQTEGLSPVGAAFVTVYPRNDQRRNFGSLVCADCIDRVRQELLVDAS